MLTPVQYGAVRAAERTFERGNIDLATLMRIKRLVKD
jgi:hypothetical protein